MKRYEDLNKLIGPITTIVAREEKKVVVSQIENYARDFIFF